MAPPPCGLARPGGEPSADRMFVCKPIEKSLWKPSFGPVRAGERIGDNGTREQKAGCRPPGRANGCPRPGGRLIRQVTGFLPTSGVVMSLLGEGN